MLFCLTSIWTYTCALSSALALVLTLTLTFPENALIFFLFHAFPSLAITFFFTSKNGKNGVIDTTFLILGLTFYGAFIGCGLSLLLTQAIPHISPMIEAFATQNGLESHALESWLSWIPGIVCVAATGITLLNCVLAQKLARHRGHLIKNLFDLDALSLPDTLLIALALSGLGAFFLDNLLETVSQTLVLMLCFPYLVFSFTTLHLVAEQAKSKKPFLLLGVYALLFLLVWPVLIMVALSIFEPWLRLRTWLTEKIKG